jgi:thiamine kinase-like enzyme
VRERVQRLAACQPALAAQLRRLGDQLAGLLESADPDKFVVAHGGYKSSQLITCPEGVYVIDFDGTCLADPALDVGCFLAYLRPSRMYCGRNGHDDLFEATGAVFVAGYRETAITSRASSDGVQGILERARLYEASHLLKIASRRLNRLNSPRPLELSRICGEIAGCLDEPGRWS